MAWVYIIRGSTGRHYIGSAVNLNARFAQHLRGHTATTKRLGDSLEIVAKKEVPTLAEAREIERSLKRKKNPKLASTIYSGRAAPKAFGVGREFDSPLWRDPFFASGDFRFHMAHARPGRRRRLSRFCSTLGVGRCVASFR